MAHLVRQRPRLAPAGDPAIDQPAVQRAADVGPQTQPLHHAGAKALDQGVGPGDQTADRLKIRRRLEVHLHRRPAPVQDRAADLLERDRRPGRPLQPQHLGSHVGQHHPGQGDRPEPVELDNPYARKGSRHRCALLPSRPLAPARSPPYGPRRFARRAPSSVG